MRTILIRLGFAGTGLGLLSLSICLVLSLFLLKIGPSGARTQTFGYFHPGGSFIYSAYLGESIKGIHRSQIEISNSSNPSTTLITSSNDRDFDKWDIITLQPGDELEVSIRYDNIYKLSDDVFNVDSNLLIFFRYEIDSPRYSKIERNWKIVNMVFTDRLNIVMHNSKISIGNTLVHLAEFFRLHYIVLHRNFTPVLAIILSFILGLAGVIIGFFRRIG